MTGSALPLPPLAPGLPLVGNVLDLAGDLGAFLTREHLRLGPVFRVRGLRRRFTVLAGRDANLFVARDAGGLLRSGDSWRDFCAELGADRALLTMDGPEHVRMRRAQQRGYSRRFVLEHLAEVVAIARREVAGWPVGERIAVVPALQRIVTEQLGTLAGGVSPGGVLDDLVVFVRTLLAARVTYQRPAAALWTPRLRRARRRVRRLCDAVRAACDPDRRSEPGGRLVDDLLALHRKDPRFLPEGDLTAAMLGPFIAGLDTVAGTCAFMLYALLKHPVVLERMRAEADEVLPDGVLSVEALRRLDVTRRVALETLRMYPIAPVLMRTAAQTFDFGGCTVPAGERVMVATTVPHRLRQYFPRPERFDIERYNAERAEHRQAGVFVPFGVGPHVCLGAGFAEAQIAATMATIVREVDLALDPPGYVLKVRHVPMPGPEDRFAFRVVGRRR